jgi:choice-of-anchor B domain-containing protein
VRRLLASALLVSLGTAVAAYATEPVQLFSLTELRADAHKSQARTTVDQNGIPLERVSDQPCVDGKAGDTQFPCAGVDLLSFVPMKDIGGAAPGGLVTALGGGASDLWGWVDPEPNAEGAHDEYVMMGKTNGVALFRITDPSNPVFLGQIPNASPGQLVWHDIKVFQDHAFIVSESVQHGMNVFDLTRLRGVTEPQTWQPDTNYPTAFSAHNIAINEETGFAYIVGGNTGLVVPDQCLSGLHMVDINDPKNPVFAGCHLTGEGRGTAAGAVGVLPESPVSYIHDTQCVVYRGPDADYTGKELCFNSSEDHMSIVDVTNKLLPTQVALVEYPETAYAHQGWLTADQSFFLMGDELDEGSTAERTRTLVFDVRDLDNATFVGSNDGETPAIDHNMYEKNGLFYQSNYAAGLRILDSSGLSPESPTLPQVAFFDGYPANDDPEFVGTWSNYPYFPSGTIAFSGIDEGLFLVKVQDDVLEQFETVTQAPADAAAPGLAVAEQAKARRRG